MKKNFLFFLIIFLLFSVPVFASNPSDLCAFSPAPESLYALAVMSYSGTWDKKTYYENQSMVLYGKCFYLALSANKELRPDKNKNIWLKIACH